MSGISFFDQLRISSVSLTYNNNPLIRSLTSSQRPLLSTRQGGKIALDTNLLSLWRQAQGRELTGIERDFHADDATSTLIRAGLACLAEAGLLERGGSAVVHAGLASVTGDPVSVIIVSHNSQPWLESCLGSLVSQSYAPLQILMVDNASSDDSANWTAMHFPQVQLIRLNGQQSLAHSVNRGIDSAIGKYFLILNPDVRLEADAIAEMVAIAANDPTSGAVAAKLKFMWAPEFLNGLGNHVGAFSWGIDNGLGHLDLGQFDTWAEVPSACFAAALVTRAAWEKVGNLDEAFALYYEDNDWCYRARLLGYRVRAAPQAIAYHAFSSRATFDDEQRMPAGKLQHVVYGRLRFAIKIPGVILAARFISAYLIEDCCGVLMEILRLNARAVKAYWSGWSRLVGDLPGLLNERRSIQLRRVQNDREIFGLQKQVPAPLIWHGLPELTWDLVKYHYLPMILSGRARSVPEFTNLHKTSTNSMAVFSMVYWIWRSGGWKYLLRRLARYLQWRLARV